MGLDNKGCHHIRCEPKCDNQSMESLPDDCNSHPMPCWRSTTSNHANTEHIYCGAGQASSLCECDYSTLRNELRNAVGVNISTQTVHNSLRQSCLRSRRECIRIPLTRHHEHVRLNCTQDHVNWTDNNWDHVLFTDE